MSFSIDWDFDCPHCGDSQNWETSEWDNDPSGSGHSKQECDSCGAKYIVDYEYDMNVILLDKPVPKVNEEAGLPDVNDPNQLKIFANL